MNTHAFLGSLIKRLDSAALASTCVNVSWSPVPYFGDLSNSRIATVGINPSDKEFVNDSGIEIEGQKRRFHTLKSLGISCWSEADNCHIQQILESCTKYFESDRNPYDRWFKRLDKIVSSTGASFYRSDACHLDLVPFATECKWSDLNEPQRSKLLCMNRDVVGQLLSISPIEVLVLNGKTAVNGFRRAASMQLVCKRMDEWAIHKQSTDIQGFAYRGVIDSLAGNQLRRRVLVLGYNHNIPGTPVSQGITDSIRNWIGKEHNCWIARTHL